METKICRKCGREFPKTDKYFQNRKDSVDGFSARCKECIGGSFSGEKVITVWTDEEISILKQCYNDYLNNEIKELFLPNKTERSIDAKAKRLNLGCKSDTAKQRSLLNMSQTKINYFKNHDGDMKGYKHTQEARKKMSKAKKDVKKWQGTDNPRSQNPLFGKENGRWRGGITELYKALRNELGQWQRDSMESCNYKCIITNSEFEDIHHLYPFKDIMEQTFENLNLPMKTCQQDYSEKEWQLICSELIRLHYLHGTGICLDKSIHKLFHDNYNYTKFTPYDFLDFVYRLDCGEFDNWLSENNIKLDINYEYIDYLESTLLLLESA